MSEKLCSLCKLLKSVEEFYVHRNHIFKRCKECESIIKYTKYNCECGRQYTYTHRLRHTRSKFHQEYIKDIKF